MVKPLKKIIAGLASGFIISLLISFFINTWLKDLGFEMEIPFWWNYIVALIASIAVLASPPATPESIEERKTKLRQNYQEKYGSIHAFEPVYDTLFEKGGRPVVSMLLTEKGIHFPEKYLHTKWEFVIDSVAWEYVPVAIPEFVSWEDIDRCYLGRCHSLEHADDHRYYETVRLVLDSGEKIDIQKPFADWETVRDSICARLIDRLFLTEDNIDIDEKKAFPFLDR